MDSLNQDLRSSLRHFRRHRGLAAAAVLVLALGIGAATAVFSVSETLLLRPLPHPAGDPLVALQPAMIGIAVGALGAAGLTRALSAMLFGVGVFDAATWVGAGLVIVAACVAAGYLPARRAARIDPMMALRAEQA